MYSIIPIHWNIKSAPASPGRSRAGPSLYVFSLLACNIPSLLYILYSTFYSLFKVYPLPFHPSQVTLILLSSTLQDTALVRALKKVTTLKKLKKRKMSKILVFFSMNNEKIKI
jgi:hypothetical protein